MTISSTTRYYVGALVTAAEKQLDMVIYLADLKSTPKRILDLAVDMAVEQLIIIVNDMDCRNPKYMPFHSLRVQDFLSGLQTARNYVNNLVIETRIRADMRRAKL